MLRNKDVAWQELDGEVVLLNLATSRYYTANRSSTQLLKLLRKGTTEELLLHAITERYDVSPERAKADLDTFLAALLDQELLVEADAAELE